MRVTTLFVSLIIYISISAALPWPANLLIRTSNKQLAARDDPPPSSSAQPASSASPNTASATGSSAPSSSPSGTDKSSPSSKPTGKSDGDKGNQTTSSISVDPLSPAGGVSMVEPAPTTTTYYKYGDNITWVWNYTSLIVTPQAVDVLVSCQDTASTFTIAQNVSVNATQTVIWDTSLETGADITDKYTMVIYDAGNKAGVSATAAPGKLAVQDALIFGMYVRQSYTPLGQGYKCVTCSGAITSAERQAIGILVTMATLTVLSFTYFTSGFMAV